MPSTTIRTAFLIGLFILSHNICDVRGASCSPSSSPLRFNSRSTALAFLSPLSSIRGRSTHFVLVDTRRHGIASSLAAPPSLQRREQMEMMLLAGALVSPSHHRVPVISSTIAATAFSFPSTLTAVTSSPWWVWSMLLIASTAGVAAEQTKIGSALSSPLITMAIALVACNLGILPTSAPAYQTVNKFLVPLAIPLLLLDANLRKVLTQTGRLLGAFVIGSFGTVLGTIVAIYLIPLRMGAEGWKIAAALAARHIGGAVNYVAVTETLATSSELTAAGIAADNLVVSFFFALLFMLAGEYADGPEPEEVMSGDSWSSFSSTERAAERRRRSFDSPALGYLKALSLSSLLCLGGTFLSESVLGGAISSLPLISMLAVIAATLFPRPLAQITEPAGHIAIVLMNLFFSVTGAESRLGKVLKTASRLFAFFTIQPLQKLIYLQNGLPSSIHPHTRHQVTGAQGRLDKVLATAPRLFAFSTIQILVHLGFLVAVGKGLFRFPLKELLVASNANIGGPTTAAAMAGSKRWKSLVLPGILVGILGYASATFIGLALGRGVLTRLAF